MRLSLFRIAPPFAVVLKISFLTVFLAAAVLAQESAFTYQGHLNDGSPANGMFTMKFRLYDSNTAGNQIGTELTRSVTVANGIFTVELDFGSTSFSSAGERFLEIEVAGTVLVPRQKATSSPYAVRALSADALSDSCVGCVTSDKLAPGIVNLKNVATLRWYEANLTTSDPNYYLPCIGVNAMRFDGNHVWYSGNCGLVKMNPFDRSYIGNVGGGGLYDMVSDGTFMWAVANGNSVGRYSLIDVGFAGSYPTGGFGARSIVFDGINLWVANFGSNNVAKLALGANNVPAAPILVTVGIRPQWMAFDGTSVWVSNTDINASNESWITKINASNNSTSNVPLPNGVVPRGLAFDGRNMWAALSNGTVAKIRVSDNATVGTYPVGVNPQAVVFDGVNIWVANTGSHTVTKLRAATGSLVGTYSSGGLSPVALSFDGTNVWVGNSGNGIVKRF